MKSKTSNAKRSGRSLKRVVRPLPREILTGQLVYACVRGYRNTGKRRLIMHEATVGPRKSFIYGAGKTWTAGIKELRAVR